MNLERHDVPFDDWVHETGDETGAQADWCVPWSDLMMVMFVLFAVLFIYEMAERDIGEALHEEPPVEAGFGDSPAVEPGRQPLSVESVFEQSLQVVRESNLENVEVVLQADRSVRLSIAGPLFFDLGTAELRPETRKFLAQVAGIVARTNYEIHVVGHTDSFPVASERFPTNWELSAVRATTVARYLIERGRVDPGRFTILGHSMYRPAVPNSTVKNKALNRRVEIIVTTKVYQGTGLSPS